MIVIKTDPAPNVVASGQIFGGLDLAHGVAPTPGGMTGTRVSGRVHGARACVRLKVRNVALRLTERALLGLRILALLEATEHALTVGEIADLTGSPRDHVSKVVHALASEGLISTIRGRRGGVRARTGPPVKPSTIVATLEACLPRRDCSPCPLAPDCALPALLGAPTEAFLETLDAQGLAPFHRASATIVRACR